MGKVSRLILYSVLGEIFTVLLLTLLNNSHSRPKLIISPLAKPVSAKNIKFKQLNSPLAIQLATVESSQNIPPQRDPDRSVGTKTNILLLGLDGRRGDSRPRCDSMHMISLDSLDETITITTVPRGIAVPAAKLATASSYLGNTCHTFGIDYTVKQIEKITGLHHDHIVKVGFSQTLGLLRYVNLPTTETLQFLRNRRYGIGDYQRSHNQALFIKDMITNKLEQLASLPKPIKYLMFRTLDTTMNFDQAQQLLDQIIDSGIYKDPGKIALVTKPDNSRRIADIHFKNLITDISGLPAQAGQKVLSASINNDFEFKNYQSNLANYLQNLTIRADNLIKRNNHLAAYKLVSTPFSQKLWLQLEQDTLRYQFQYELLRIYVLTNPDSSSITTLLLDYLMEMESLGQPHYQNIGEALLRNFQGKNPVN